MKNVALLPAVLVALFALALPRAAAADEPESSASTESHDDEGSPRAERAVAAPTRDVEGAEEPAHHEPRRYFFRVGYENVIRDFADTEAAPGAVRTYHAYPIPAAAVSAELYPLFDGMLGVEGAYAQSFGVESSANFSEDASRPPTENRPPAPVDTTYRRAEVALKGRYLFTSKANSPYVSVFAGYGYTGFTFAALPPGPSREIPSARYGAMRLGTDGRVEVQRFHFTGAIEYDHLVSIGDLGPSRTRVPGYGITAALGAGYSLTPYLAANLGGRLAWFTYDFNRFPNAQCVDRYITVALSLEASF